MSRLGLVERVHRRPRRHSLDPHSPRTSLELPTFPCLSLFFINSSVRLNIESMAITFQIYMSVCYVLYGSYYVLIVGKLFICSIPCLSFQYSLFQLFHAFPRDRVDLFPTSLLLSRLPVPLPTFPSLSYLYTSTVKVAPHTPCLLLPTRPFLSHDPPPPPHAQPS